MNLLLFLGKSSLTIQFVEGQFVDSYDPTIENSKFHIFPICLVLISFHSYKWVSCTKINDHNFTSAFSKPWKMKGQEFELKLVDTAGQDEYAIFPAQHSMDMHGYVMVYSITSLQSFELVQVLLEKIMDMTGKITSVFQLIFK